MMRSLSGLMLLVLVAVSHAESFEHEPWDRLLKAHVVSLHGGLVTQVDYAGMQREHDILQRYLAKLSAVKKADFDRWPRNERLAFLINAYNAWTVELVLEKYPALTSIRDLGSVFQSPWKRSFIPLLGEKLSLDDIEHGLIRGGMDYRDPRIHFAVNCASIGCPALRPEAYVAAALNVQLDDATRKFLADRKRNRVRSDSLELSSIFKWYHEDFEKGWSGFKSLPDFLANYAAPLGLSNAQLSRLTRGEMPIDFLDYDWRLNGKS